MRASPTIWTHTILYRDWGNLKACAVGWYLLDYLDGLPVAKRCVLATRTASDLPRRDPLGSRQFLGFFDVLALIGIGRARLMPSCGKYTRMT